MRHHFFPVLSSLLAGHWIYEYFKKSSCSLPEITWKWSRGEDELAIKRKKSHILSFIAINQTCLTPKTEAVEGKRTTADANASLFQIWSTHMQIIWYILYFLILLMAAWDWRCQLHINSFSSLSVPVLSSPFGRYQTLFYCFFTCAKKNTKLCRCSIRRSFSFYFWQETTMLVEKKNPHKCI